MKKSGDGIKKQLLKGKLGKSGNKKPDSLLPCILYSDAHPCVVSINHSDWIVFCTGANSCEGAETQVHRLSRRRKKRERMVMGKQKGLSI